MSSFCRKIKINKMTVVTASVFTLFAFACAGGVLTRPLFAEPAGGPQPLRVGDKAPAITVIDAATGGETSLKFSGGGSLSPALLWFWFMSCENCVRDMKFMCELAEKYRSSIAMVAINVDRPSERPAVVNFIKTSGIAVYKNYFDRITSTPFTVSYDASDAFGIVRTPALFVIGGDGKVVASFEGDVDFDEVEKNIEKALIKQRDSKINDK